MSTVTDIANRNNAQSAYMQARRDAKELLRKIERGVIDLPASAEGRWDRVGSVQALVADLQAISDRLHGEGEYAHKA